MFLLARHYGEPSRDPSALPTYYAARETRRVRHRGLERRRGTRTSRDTFGTRGGPGAHRARAVPGAGLERGPKRFPYSEIAGVPRGGVWRGSALDGERGGIDPAARHLGFFVFSLTRSNARSIRKPSLPGLPRDGRCAIFDKLFDRAPSADVINRTLYTDFSTYLPECLMTKVDIASMAVSLRDGRRS
ncbi:MAG: hypothetical protein IPP35_12140 [Elusimicrobia bacterium]|nr:hypothetical protein [Elusimicrobiota bacterium]